MGNGSGLFGMAQGLLCLAVLAGIGMMCVMSVSVSSAQTGKSPGKFQVEVLSRAAKSIPLSGEVNTATFAGGCFWGIQLAFERLPGVFNTTVGYTSGHTSYPAYNEVSSGSTGHAEAVQVTFDPSIVTYRELVKVLFEVHDPTTLNRQGNDVGTQYRSGIYFHNAEQQAVAEQEKALLSKALNKQVVTEVLPASDFWEAEDYHQHYLSKGGQSSRKGEMANIRCYG